MIDGLVSGRLYGTAQVRTGQHGTHFVTCRVRASAGDGESLFVNVIAFDDTVKDALQALDDAGHGRTRCADCIPCAAQTSGCTR
jgi:hypothetical protein